MAIPTVSDHSHLSSTCLKLTLVAHNRHCESRHNKGMEFGRLGHFLDYCEEVFQDQLGKKGLKWEDYKWRLLRPEYTAPLAKSACSKARTWLEKYYVGPNSFGQDEAAVKEKDPGAQSFLGGLTPSMGTTIHKRVS